MPKISRVFSLSRRKIRSFLPSLGGLSRGILVVFEVLGAQMCTFGVLGLSFALKVAATAAVACAGRTGAVRRPRRAALGLWHT